MNDSRKLGSMHYANIVFVWAIFGQSKIVLNILMRNSRLSLVAFRTCIVVVVVGSLANTQTDDDARELIIKQ